MAFVLPTHMARAIAAACLALAIARPLAAQDASPSPSPWRPRLDLDASLFFGATSQRLLSTAAGLTRADSALELDASIQYRYGEAADAEGARFVSARSWAVILTADPIPHERLTPFFFATLESSLERRIARRYDAGAGGKWVFSRDSAGSASVSLGLLGERTRAMAPATQSAEALLRWSARLRAKRRVQERLTISHVTFYQPAATRLARYTVRSTSELSYAATGAVAVTLSFLDVYDSEARRRGARANNDGQLLFGVRMKR